MNREEIEAIVELTVAKTMASDDFKEMVNQHCNDRLKAMGVDWESPEGVREFIQDQMYLRAWRTSIQRGAKVGMGTLITVVVTGILAMLWLGFQATIGLPPH